MKRGTHFPLNTHTYMYPIPNYSVRRESFDLEDLTLASREYDHIPCHPSYDLSSVPIAIGVVRICTFCVWDGMGRRVRGAERSDDMPEGAWHVRTGKEKEKASK